ERVVAQSGERAQSVGAGKHELDRSGDRFAGAGNVLELDAAQPPQVLAETNVDLEVRHAVETARSVGAIDVVGDKNIRIAVERPVDPRAWRGASTEGDRTDQLARGFR